MLILKKKKGLKSITQVSREQALGKDGKDMRSASKQAPN